MKKIDRTVLRETVYIATFVLIFSMLLESIFLIIGKWDLKVLFGNLLGAFSAVLNFFLMGLTVQKAVTQDEKKSKVTMKVSQMSRLFMLFLIAVIAYAIPSAFNIIAVVIPYIFPRIAIALRPIFIKNKKN